MFNHFVYLCLIHGIPASRRLIIGLIGLFICGNALGQQVQGARNLDSLLEVHTARDSVRFKLLDEKFMEQFYFSFDPSLLAYGEEMLSIAQELSAYQMGVAYQRLGIVYDFVLSEPFMALDYYQQSTEAAEAISATSQEVHEQKIGFLTSNYANIGNIYMKLGDHDRALEYLHQAIDIREKEGLAVLHTTYNSLSTSYARKGAYGDALRYAELALENGKDDGVHFQANYLSSLATILLYVDSIPQAKAYMEEALSLVEQYDIASVRPIVYSTVSGIYIKSGEYTKGEHYALAALELLGHQAMHYENRMVTWGNLAQTYYATGRYKEAADAMAEQSLLKDSLNDASRKIELSRLEMQYEYERKEALTHTEIQRHKATRNTIITGSALLLFMGTGGWVAYKKRQDSLKKQRELAFKASLSETEMKVLRLQMNPHFIFNSLNSISDYINKNDTESADYYLAKFAKLMRGILENSEEQEISLADELKMLQLYMQLEASRLDGKFTHEIKAADDINPEQVMVPPLILQPFVENSIWHGIAHKEGQGRIIIEVSKENDMLSCLVEDDGVGRSVATATVGRKSYGVNVTKDRIDMLNKLKNTNASVNIVDLEQGTRVEIKLPLEGLS